MKTLSHAYRLVIIAIILLLSSIFCQGQVKGLYIDFFGNYILHDATLKSNLINYASANGFNYLLLYDINGNVLDYTLNTGSTLSTNQQLLRDFISDAKSIIGGLQIGVSGSSLKPNQTQSEFFDNVKWFNDLVQSNQRIDVIHLEDEYWLGTPANYQNYITQLTHMWNDIRNTVSYTLIVETYLGAINTLLTIPETTQVADIDPITDRILLHCYMPNQFMQNRINSPGYVNMQFEYDWGAGERYKNFAGNAKTTHIIPIFSAEACDISQSSTNYYGDYLWFDGILTNGTAPPLSTATELNYPFLPLTYEGDINQPLQDFMNSYNNNTDPYDNTGNPTRGFPCGSNTNIASCTNNSTAFPNGNIIDGEMWFKYGLMPLKDNHKPIYLDCGIDMSVQQNGNHTIEPIEFFSNLQTIIGQPFFVTKYNWYKNGEYISTTFASQPNYQITADPIIGVTDIYTCEAITNFQPPYALSYRIRDDIKITSSPNPGFSFYLSSRIIPATCPGYNNGSIEVFPQGCGCSASYSWSTGQSTKLITGLTPGIYTVTAYPSNNNYSPITAHFEVLSFDNSPHPVIFKADPFLSCDNHLTVSDMFTNYQWFLNGTAIGGATSNSYTAIQNGDYTVQVTNVDGCTGSSNIFNLNLSLSSIISGPMATCQGTEYTVPDAGIGAIYVWSIPPGATFFQNKNYINVTWGPAYSTGGTITCAITNGCGQSSSSSIQVNGLSVTAASTPSCLTTNNGSVGINSILGGTGSYQFLWNTNPVSNLQLVTSVSAGTYTITVTDQSTGCTATAITIVTTVPTNIPTPIITGTISASPGTHIYNITNYVSAYDNLYSWNVIANSGNAIISYPNGNKQAASIQWPPAGGKIIVTFGVPGCIQSGTFYVQPYCTNTWTYLDGQDQTSFNSTSPLSRTNMTFNGLFTISNDFVFQNCGQVSFASGAKILVKTGKTLTIDNCTFISNNSCCKMWKGIELEAGAKIIIKNNSYISQAECGLLVNNNCVYTITGSHFRNNYIGMQIGNGSPMNITGSIIKSTDFYSDAFICGGTNYSPFVNRYDGQLTNPVNRPLSGIIVNNCSYFKFGYAPNVAGGDIRFYNLSNGIIANNSNIYISNFSFKNMISETQYSSMVGTYNGCGVRADHSNIYVQGLGGLYNSDYTIENCNYGFYLSRGNGEISHVNTKNDTYTGAYISYCRDVNIHDNVWQCRLYGINTHNNSNASLLIERNDFRMSTTIGSVACIQNNEYAHYSNLVIRNNTIKMNLCRYGISNIGVINGEIKENSIEMNNNANSYGIYSVYSSRSTYKCNSVNALQTYSNPQTGMYFSSGTGNTISCNWVNRQQYGITFNGTCTDTRLEGTSFNSHDVGLGLYYNPIIGNQNFAGNAWNGTYTSYGAYLSQMDQQLADDNRFVYDLNGLSNNYPTVTNDIFGYNWFFGNPDQQDFSCVNFDCQPTIPREEEIKEDDERIAEANPPGNPIEENSNYLADKFLFEKLRQNPDFLLGNPILEAFYNQQLYGNIGLYTELREEIAAVVKWETVYEMVYSTNEIMIRNLTDSINDLDSLLNINPSSNIIRDQISDLNFQVRNAMSSNEALSQTINQISDYRNTNATTVNGNLPANEVYEYNERAVNEIYLNTLARGITTFTTTEEATLINIMEQCPFTGGPSVYLARSLYSLIDNTIIWNDHAICTSSGVTPRLSDKEVNQTIELFPNPTSGLITINYNIKSEDIGTIEIITSLGVTLLTEKLLSEKNQIELNLTGFKPAIYFYKVIMNGNIQKKGFISIVR